jgi:hypothetical protein
VGWGWECFCRKGRPLSWQEAALREEGGACSCSCSWCKPKVAEKPPPPRGGRRAQEPSTGTPPPPPPLSLRAPPLSQIFSLPTDPPLSALASTPWAIRLLILLHHRLLAEAAARCPVWAREARDPQQRTPGRARPLVGARKGRGDGMQSGRR